MATGRSRAAGLFALIVAFAIAICPLVLHLTQRRHDVLPFDVEAQFPATRKVPNGEVFAATVIALVEHELSSSTGWRPNDFFLWGPRLWADNNANRQLGIIQAVRESVRILKDNLTKVSATQFDPRLVEADTEFRNDARKLWLPSAESRFRKGNDALRAYIAGLNATPPTSKPITLRNTELIRLFQGWTDLLGDAHANLFKQWEDDGSSVAMWRTDDYFYHAQGFAHVLHHLMLAVQREYATSVADRPSVLQLFDEVADALGRAATLKPLVVLDGHPDGLVANHRRNLDAYIVEARQKMYSIRDELEK
jgi:hypothetical protein